jgi:membrane-associated protein
MIDLDLTALFLNGMASAGPVALGLAALLSALGLPLPAAILVSAAGAFARQGTLDWRAALVLGLAGAVLGDSASYGLGRCATRWLPRAAGRRRAAAGQVALEQFEEHGTAFLLLTRFALTSLDVPTSLVAGGGGYPFRRFLACALAGRAAWILLYGGLGYALGSRWQAVGQLAGRYGAWLAGALILGIGLSAALRRLRVGKSDPRRPLSGQVRLRPGCLAGACQSRTTVTPRPGFCRLRQGLAAKAAPKMRRRAGGAGCG